MICNNRRFSFQNVILENFGPHTTARISSSLVEIFFQRRLGNEMRKILASIRWSLIYRKQRPARCVSRRRLSLYLSVCRKAIVWLCWLLSCLSYRTLFDTPVSRYVRFFLFNRGRKGADNSASAERYLCTLWVEPINDLSCDTVRGGFCDSIGSVLRISGVMAVDAISTPQPFTFMLGKSVFG